MTTQNSNSSHLSGGIPEINIKPPIPPNITPRDLIPTGKAVRVPNAFIAYRKALTIELKSKKVSCHRSDVSSYASRLWAEESEDVKNIYRKMVIDAQSLCKQSASIDDDTIQANPTQDDDETNVSALMDYSLIQQYQYPPYPPSLQYPLLQEIPQSSSRSNELLSFDQSNPGLTEFNPFDENLLSLSSSPATFPTYSGNFYTHPSLPSATRSNVTSFDQFHQLDQRVKLLEQRMDLLYEEKERWRRTFLWYYSKCTMKDHNTFF